MEITLSEDLQAVINQSLKNTELKQEEVTTITYTNELGRELFAKREQVKNYLKAKGYQTYDSELVKGRNGWKLSRDNIPLKLSIHDENKAVDVAYRGDTTYLNYRLFCQKSPSLPSPK